MLTHTSEIPNVIPKGFLLRNASSSVFGTLIFLATAIFCNMFAPLSRRRKLHATCKAHIAQKNLKTLGCSPRASCNLWACGEEGRHYTNCMPTFAYTSRWWRCLSTLEILAAKIHPSNTPKPHLDRSRLRRRRWLWWGRWLLRRHRCRFLRRRGRGRFGRRCRLPLSGSGVQFGPIRMWKKQIKLNGLVDLSRQ